MVLRGKVEMNDYCKKPFISADKKQTEEIKSIVDDVEKMLQDIHVPGIV